MSRVCSLAVLFNYSSSTHSRDDCGFINKLTSEAKKLSSVENLL